MKIPRGLSAPVDSTPDPIVAVVCGLSDARLRRRVRENVVAEHRSLSKAARQSQRLAGDGGRGVFSVEVGAGSRPGTSDATFIPRSDFLATDPEVGEEDRRHDDAVRAALEAYDPEAEFVLQLILGGFPWVYRVRHHRAAAEDLPGERPTLAPQIVDTGAAA